MNNTNTQQTAGTVDSTPRTLVPIMYLGKEKTGKSGKAYRGVARVTVKSNNELKFDWDSGLVAFPSKGGGFTIMERVESEE